MLFYQLCLIGKNGQNKRGVKVGNNSINVCKTIMSNENHMNAVLKYFGWFNCEKLRIVQLSNEIETSAPYLEIVQNLKKEEIIVAEKILYKNTEYSCSGQTIVLIHETAKKSSFLFGILTKIILKKSPQMPVLLYQLTKSTYLKDMGLYKVEPIEEFDTIEIEDLASFHPMQLHYLEVSPSEKLILASLRNQPILFPE